MQRNRFFKSTPGINAEYVIASSLDNSQAPVLGVKPTAATVTVTVAATPALNDKITIFINGVEYAYIVQAGDTTAATLDASILALLNTNAQGFTATLAGTTSAVFTLASTVANANLNGVVVSVVLGTPNVSTFSAATTANFGTNGVTPVAGGPQSTINGFVTNAASGALGVYWKDTNVAVQPGETGLFINAQREFYYAWKTQDGNTILTTEMQASTRSYRSVPYFAGAVDVWTYTFTGTYTLGQILHVFIIDITSTQVPYQKYEYIVVSTGVIATDLTALAVLINAESQDPVATASATGGVLTVTGTFNSRQLKPGFALEAVGPNSAALGIDQSICVFAHSTVSQAEVGTTADVKYFEQALLEMNGVMVYTQEGILPSELSSISELVVGGVQYGYLNVTSEKTLSHRGAATNNKSITPKVIQIAVPSTALAQLASY